MAAFESSGDDPARTAHGREAVHQEPLRDDGVVAEIGELAIRLDASVVVVDHHVDLPADQSGHQRAAATVDDGGTGRIDRVLRHAPDQVALDQHARPASQAVGLALEDIDVGRSRICRSASSA